MQESFSGNPRPFAILGWSMANTTLPNDIWQAYDTVVEACSSAILDSDQTTLSRISKMRIMDTVSAPIVVEYRNIGWMSGTAQQAAELGEITLSQQEYGRSQLIIIPPHVDISRSWIPIPDSFPYNPNATRVDTYSYTQESHAFQYPHSKHSEGCKLLRAYTAYEVLQMHKDA